MCRELHCQQKASASDDGVLQSEGILINAETSKSCSSSDGIEFYSSWELHRNFLRVVVKSENDANKAVKFASQENVSVLFINIKPSVSCPLPLVLLNEEQVNLSQALKDRVVKAKFNIVQQAKLNEYESSPEAIFGDFVFTNLYDQILYKEAKKESKQ